MLQDGSKAAQGSLGQLSSLRGIPPLPAEDFVPLLAESSSVAQPSGTPPPPPADSNGALPPGAGLTMTLKPRTLSLKPKIVDPTPWTHCDLLDQAWILYL